MTMIDGGRVRRVAQVAALLSVFAAACESEPAKNPDEGNVEATATATSAPVETTDPVATTAPTQTSAAPTAPPVEEAPALVYEGLKITPAKAGKIKKIEVGADGKVTLDGKVVASFEKNELRNETGSGVLKVHKDGSVEPMAQGMSAEKAKFDDKNDLVTPDGKIAIGADGSVTFERKGKPEKAPVKVEGVNDKNKRAAVLLVTYVFLSTSATKTTEKSSAGTAPAATATASPKK